VQRALPPDVVVLQAGPQRGTYDEHARRYARQLADAGLKTEVQNFVDSVQIAGNLNAPDGRVQIGFMAQSVDPKAYPQVMSAGVIELQPLFLFVRSSLGPLASPAALLGRRLVMPPEGSATAQAVRDVLALYGVTPANARFTYLPIAEAVVALQQGEHDAGFFMLAPSNAMINRLAHDDRLRLVDFHENVGISRNIDYLKPAVLARGAFDLRAVLPPQDVALVGATVNVIVRQDIHPAVLYALLNAMKDVHKGQTLVSGAGEYPTLVGTVLPLHPLANEWAKSGTPWLYTHLPPSLAGLVDVYWGPALFLLALVSAFGTLRSLNEFIHAGALSVALLFLLRLQARVDAGREPGFLSRRLFRVAESIVLMENKADQAREQLARLRPHINRA
jgi:TRAP-type uncharacterized transport system substrate-binding protein